MEEKKIQELFMQGYDCSQVVLTYFAEKLGMTTEMANKVSACFGGGMMQADACGAYTGALMAIGLKYGHYNPENLMDQKNVMMAKTAEFKQKFYEKYDTCNCRDLLGYDVSTPEGFEAAISSGRMMGFCPTLVNAVIEILEEVL